VLAERLSFEQAGAVCQILRSHQYAVRAVPVEKLPSPAKGRTLRWLEITDEHLGLPVGYQGDVQRVPWPCVFVISAGQVSEVKEQQVETVKPDYHHLPVTEVQTRRRSERVHVAELYAVSTAGEFLHVRLPAHEMNYDRTLGRRPDAGYFEKYLEVLDQLTARSAAALVSPETLALLRERRQNYESFDGDSQELIDERQFSQYNRWLLTLVLLREEQNQPPA
jgi:hypothetical protein